jgi:hypothetical protein
VLSQAEMDGRARSIRGALRRRLMDGVAAGEVDRDNPISPWLIGQVIGAAYRDPGAPAAELKPLLQLFDLTHGTPPLDHRAGDLKSAGPTSTETRPTAPLQALGAAARAEHKFWVIMALAAVLARPELLNPDEVERFKQYLRIAQQRADVHYPLANGGWNTAPRQVNPANHFTYTSGLALHAMLEVYAAGLGWHDSRERLAQMITETSRWLNDAFVQDGGRSGWRISVDDDRLPESGTSLFIHAALGRACAEAGIPIADDVREAALSLQAGLRHRTYDSVDPDIRFDVRVVEDNGAVTGQVTVTRMIWYPWAVEGLAAWRRCAEKNGYAPEVRRALDRSLGHLLADVAPDVLRDVTRRQRQLFVTAETYYGLGKAP